MNRLRSLLFVHGLLAIASQLMACGVSAEPVAPTAAPAATSLASKSEGPTTVDEVPRISVEELKQRLDKGEEIVIVDTRGKSV